MLLRVVIFWGAYFSYYPLPWEVVARYANVLYMLFFASCMLSLKKSQLETKRVGNKRQAYNYKKSLLVLLTSLR